jgi:hypothetical protein
MVKLLEASGDCRLRLTTDQRVHVDRFRSARPTIVCIFQRRLDVASTGRPRGRGS